jgi:hypothetical protein
MKTSGRFGVAELYAANLAPGSVSSESMQARSEAPKKRSSGPIPITRQRALMDLARANAERDREKPRRPLAVTIGSALLAVAIVLVVGRGFDLFLGGFQRLLERIAREDEAAEIAKPHPVFVVPEQPALDPPTDAGNDSAQAPAGE